MAFLKKNWCLIIITTLLFLLVYTIYTSSIPLPDVVNHVDDHITVGFSQIETDNPWRTTQINSFREAFGPSNIEFIYHEPEEYTAKWQQEDITKLIREKVDYLVIVPADLDALVPALESAKEAGIPVILIEQSADTIDRDLYMSRISADYLREGAICAQLLAEKYAGRSCNIVEIYGTESSPSAKARSKGFHQALKNYPQLHIIDTEYGNFDRVTAQKAMENALVKTSDSHKSVQAVFAHSDEDGLGALQAIKTAGLSPNDISIHQRDPGCVQGDHCRGIFRNGGKQSKTRIYCRNPDQSAGTGIHSISYGDHPLQYYYRSKCRQLFSYCLLTAY